MKKNCAYFLSLIMAYALLASDNSNSFTIPKGKNKTFNSIFCARIYATGINAAGTVNIGNDLTVGQRITFASLTPLQAVATDSGSNLISLAYATEATPDTLAYRDANGTIQVAVPVNQNDAVNKAYVDSLVLDLDILPAVVALADSNVTLSGTQIIDGVALVAGNRVLLINQTDGVENGVWVVAAGAWVRPPDFANGDDATLDFAFVQQGTVYANSGWVCTTSAPDDIIGTDPLTFEQFSGAGSFTLANVGSGSGQVFKNQTGSTFNLRTISNGTHVTVTNNTNDIAIATDATSASTPNTLIARDGSGNFSAGTITATLNGNFTGDVLAPAGSATSPSISFSGDTNTGLSAAVADTLVLSTNGANRLQVGSTGTVTVAALNAAGVVHTDSSGNFSTSTIVNADINASAAIVDTKLATIATAGKVANSATTADSANTANALVTRDASGNFSAGTITATLNGNFTGNVLAPAGSATSPSISFSGDTNTGLSAAVADTLVLSTNGTNRLQVGSTGTVTVAGNIQYNSLNSVGTASLGGVAMTASNFPKIVTINSSLSVANLALLGSVNVDLTSFGFTAAPICVVTPTTSIGALGFANFYTSGITTTNVTVNALVGVAAVGIQNINFSLVVIGY